MYFAVWKSEGVYFIIKKENEEGSYLNSDVEKSIDYIVATDYQCF